ncbi:hypothetical protein, partial [Acinetobacter pittii]|uniref:hypothetical protein n=1 Tax=Acinetobacter pittii TaxID=48296 RepID=UPI00202A63F3
LTMIPLRLFAILIVALVAYSQAEPEPSPIISSFLDGVSDAAYDYGYGRRSYRRPRYYPAQPVYQQQPVVYQQPAYQQPAYQQASPIAVSQSQSTVTNS